MVKFTDKIEKLLACLIFFSVLFSNVPAGLGEGLHLDQEVLDSAEHKYGKDARMLLVAWEDLINQKADQNDLDKLELVNNFFNRMEFVDDLNHWGMEDYWATPIEFLGTKGGDCEDFSIAKYFTLKAMGVAEEKLNLTYVKALQYNVHHMVLTYYAEPDAEPLVLDNFVKDIRPATERVDLIPIYSFNGTGLWLAMQRGRGRLAGSSSSLKLWQNLMQRMTEYRLSR